MKKILIAMAAMAAMTMPVRADEAELLARIEALELRVAQLEALIIGGNEEITEQEVTGSEAIDTFTLNTGTWIVGDDFPSGKYNITCISGAGMIYFYNSYEDRKNNPYLARESYYLSTQGLIDELADFYGSDDLIAGIYKTEINNIRLSDGDCVHVEASSVQFVPVE